MHDAKTESYAFIFGALPIRYSLCGLSLYYAPLLSMANGNKNMHLMPLSSSSFLFFHPSSPVRQCPLVARRRNNNQAFDLSLTRSPLSHSACSCVCVLVHALKLNRNRPESLEGEQVQVHILIMVMRTTK